jgi:GNAT superfamily N-acetyltransferase
MALGQVNRQRAQEILRTTLAADYSCQPSDWLSDEIIVVEARFNEGRRRFPLNAKPFGMMTLGRGVVVACSAERMSWAESNLCHLSRDHLFSAPVLASIVNYVAPDQQRLGGPYQMNVCGSDTFRPVAAPAGITFELYEREQMAEVYAFVGFDHALSYRPDNPSPDMIAVVARRDAQVVGIAGVGADSDQLWQVGIDVVPQWQGIGLGKALVSRATAAILERGKTPYYVHHVSNVRSGNTARAVGFQWACTECYVRNL